MKLIIEHFPITPISRPGKGAAGRTGFWRTHKPVINYDRCIDCLICWVYCPDSTIIRLPNNKVKIDYEYCKGCGICANECPVKAIEMVEEA